jgi:hypothetical protein
MSQQSSCVSGRGRLGCRKDSSASEYTLFVMHEMPEHWLTGDIVKHSLHAYRREIAVPQS